MDRYVLDANAIFGDFRFERNPGRLLLREARHRRIKLLVAQIVFDEAVNLFRESVEEQSRIGRRSLRRLQGMNAIDAGQASLTIDVDAAVALYADELMEIFLNAGAGVLPYPSVPHEDIVARALKRSRPFDGNGQNGYRDVLLWETLLEAADPTAPIVLISADKSAFGSKPRELHPDLAAELESLGLQGAIRKIKQVADFTDELPTIPTLRLGLEHLLASGAHWNTIVDSIEEEALDWHEGHTHLIGLPLEIEDLYIESVDDVREFQVKSVKALDEDQLALDLEAWVDMTFEAYVSLATAQAYHGDDLKIIRYETGESRAQGVVQRRVRTEIWARLDQATNSFLAIDVYNFLPLGSVDDD